MKGYAFKMEAIFCVGMLISSACFFARNDRAAEEERKHRIISEARESLVFEGEDEVASEAVSEVKNEEWFSEEPKIIDTEKKEIQKNKAIIGYAPDFPSRSVLKDFIKSWENSALYRAEMSHDYSEIKINDYITPDGVYYRVTDDGVLNIGYGIVVKTGTTIYNESIFERYGIFSEDLQNVQEGSLIYRDTIDAVMFAIIESIRNEVINSMNQNGVSLESYQIDALTSVCYQFGITGSNLNEFATLYKEYGVSPQLQEKYHTKGGSKPFMQIPGGTSYDGTSRAEANWAMFSEAKVIICKDINC